MSPQVVQPPSHVISVDGAYKMDAHGHEIEVTHQRKKLASYQRILVRGYS
jgi:hypothetical protein